MEKKAQYIVVGQPISLVERSSCTLPFADPAYEPPRPDQVDALIKSMGWSQSDVARLVGVSYSVAKGSTTVRKWRTPLGQKEHREIPYAAWRLMVIEAQLAQYPEGKSPFEASSGRNFSQGDSFKTIAS